MLKNNIPTYLGFAKKSNQIVYGIDNLAFTKKKIELVLVCATISEKSYKNVQFLATKNKWPHAYLHSVKLDDVLFTKNCKIVGLTNASLAQAIIKEIEKISDETISDDTN